MLRRRAGAAERQSRTERRRKPPTVGCVCPALARLWAQQPPAQNRERGERSLPGMCLAPFSLRARTPELPSDMGIDTGDARRRSKCAPGCQVAILIGLGDAARSVVNASLRRAKGRARKRRIRERLGPESQSNYGGGRALARVGRHRRRWHYRGTHRRRALASRCAGPGSAGRSYTAPTRQ